MKNIVIAGNIGRSAETRSTPAGDNVTSWSVAVTDRTASAKDTPPMWFDCSMWGSRGEKLAPYLVKGGKVTVAGELTRREHEGKTYLGIRVADVTLQGERGDREAVAAEPAPKPVKAPSRADDIDDEIPF